ERRLNPLWREVDRGRSARVTDRQCLRRPLERTLARLQRQMADPAARGHPGIGEVGPQTLLELARGGGRDQRRTRRAAAVAVGEEPGAAGLRARAGRGGRRSPGAAGRADAADEDDGAHPSLADADEVTARLSPSRPNGEGGRSRTVTVPPPTAPPTRARA